MCLQVPCIIRNTGLGKSEGQEPSLADRVLKEGPYQELGTEVLETGGELPGLSVAHGWLSLL